ncbi:MAG: DUF3368 domain-containing protein [Candidatus Methanospirareceae archaeon]
MHKDEAEAIALAIERHAKVIFMDELEARRAADVYGLRKTGILGILIRAKLENKVVSLREELDSLRNDAGFWIRDELYQRVLHEIGEATDERNATTYILNFELDTLNTDEIHFYLSRSDSGYPYPELSRSSGTSATGRS